MAEKKEVRENLLKLDLMRRKFLRPHFLELGLTVGQGQPRILNSLLTKNHMTQRELSDLCDIDVTTMSRTLDKMEEAGLICREKNPDCRRSHRIALTRMGEEKAEQVREIFNALDEVIWQGFTGEEMDALLYGVKKIMGNLEGMAKDE
ncbi:MarR family winged helix-turn-helix transcriptional regulator [Anaerolentibacter hominis]|uniref:MarR family winged helix-turn-helix transcriptional regulator n=1 Tax=Anaerolentibacter hominis TaxID=3079009 RepID=UPI0031B88A7D